MELNNANVFSRGNQTDKVAFLCAFKIVLFAYISHNSCNRSPRTTLCFFTNLINEAQALLVNLLVLSMGFYILLVSV